MAALEPVVERREEEEEQNNTPTEPDSRDTTKYTNLFLHSCEIGEPGLLHFLFAEELYGRKRILDEVNRWFVNDISEYIWSFLVVPMDVNFSNVCGMTGLIRAAKKGHTNVVKLLLQIPGIDVNARDKNGLSALLHATRRRHLDVVSLLLQNEKVNINCTDEHGRTPLMVGCQKRVDVSMFLRHPNIDLNQIDVSGKVTALTLAARYGHKQAVERLVCHEKMNTCLPLHDEKNQLEVALLQAYDRNKTQIIDVLESRR